MTSYCSNWGRRLTFRSCPMFIQLAGPLTNQPNLDKVWEISQFHCGNYQRRYLISGCGFWLGQDQRDRIRIKNSARGLLGTLAFSQAQFLTFELQLNVEIIPRSSCHIRGVTITKRMICAGDLKGGKDACQVSLLNSQGNYCIKMHIYVVCYLLKWQIPVKMELWHQHFLIQLFRATLEVQWWPS